MSDRHLRLLITGTRGQVVTSLIELGALQPDIEIVPLGRPALDLASVGSIRDAIIGIKPDAIISAAAYTAVDLAESEPELAELINGRAPGEIGKAASVLGVPVVHLSTDYVFDGSKAEPYRETDPVAPLGVYGRTKLAGERALQAVTDNVAILRTAWVYSPFGKNFLRTMLRLAGERDEVGVVADQIGNPTSALDIADAVITVTRNLLAVSDPALRGLFHMSGQGVASWAEFAEHIFQMSQEAGGPSALVRPIATDLYPTPARRPANSRLDCARLAQRHHVRLPDWRGSASSVVRRCLART